MPNIQKHISTKNEVKRTNLRLFAGRYQIDCTDKKEMLGDIRGLNKT